MELLAVEAIEAVAHGAECKGIQSQPGPVGRYINRAFWRKSSPFQQALGDDVIHLAEHALQI